MHTLPQVRAGLLRHPLDKQVLVYDSGNGLVHLLDPATACVLDLLEEGGRSAEEITQQVAIRLDVAENPDLLPLAMDELRKANLLDLRAVGPLAPLAGVNRRDMLVRLAATGAAVLAVPAIATLTATRGYAQTSAQIGIGGACTQASQCLAPATSCCSGICREGACSTGTLGRCERCSTDNDCASGDCTSSVCGGAPTNNSTIPNGEACKGHGNCCSDNCFVVMSGADGTCSGTPRHVGSP